MTKKVLCIETNTTYNSATEAARENGCTIHLISAACLGKVKTAKGKHFKYVEMDSEAEKKIPVHKETIIRGKGKRSNGNCHAVFDMTTGDIYSSGADAAEGIGCHFSNVSATCRGLNKTCRGHKICFVSKIDEHIPEISEAISKANAYDELLFKEHARKELQDFIAAKETEVLELTKALNKAKDEIAEAKAKLVYM